MERVIWDWVMSLVLDVYVSLSVLHLVPECFQYHSILYSYFSWSAVLSTQVQHVGCIAVKNSSTAYVWANCSRSCYLMENRDTKITVSIFSQAILKHSLEIQKLVLFSLSRILGSIFNWIKRNARAVPLLDMHGCLHCSDFSLKCTQYTLSS